MIQIKLGWNVKIIIILVVVLIILILYINTLKNNIINSNDNEIEGKLVQTIDLDNIHDALKSHYFQPQRFKNSGLVGIKTEVKDFKKENDDLSTTDTIGSIAKYVEKFNITDSVKSFKTGANEELCREILQNIFQKPFRKVRPRWLMNPKTHHFMELDCYNDELRLAVEYKGIQHYVWPNFTKQSRENFNEQAMRDDLKRELCDKNGVYLISISYKIPPDRIRSFIIKNIPKSIDVKCLKM